MSKEALILLAEGFEEIEAITIIDVLRRAGVQLIIAGVEGKIISGAHGLKVEAELILSDYTNIPDVVILPGGLPGADNLKASSEVNNMIKKVYEDKKIVAAICASPAVVLSPLGVLDGKKATCYPGFEDNFSDSIERSEEAVVIDENIITSRGPGTAFEFALTLVKQLVDIKTAVSLRQGMLY